MATKKSERAVDLLSEARAWLLVEQAMGNVSARDVYASVISSEKLSAAGEDWLREVAATRLGGMQSVWAAKLIQHFAELKRADVRAA